MKLAIHKPDYPNSFSHKWIEYCNINNIDYIIVDCLENDIIKTLKNSKVTHLLWAFSQLWKDLMTARNVLFSAEMMGLKVFPNKYTSWHFDDKISQKYLFEAMNIDSVSSYVFYNHDIAKKWVSQIEQFPLVFKLRRGSGSTSVKLMRSREDFIRNSNRMFSRGISPISSISHDFSKRVKSIKTLNDLKIAYNKIITRISNKIFGIHTYPNEVGYIYAQEFIKDNNFDIRIVVIGNKAYGIKRMVRKNDFRASGSGNIIYDVSQIDINCVSKSFKISEKLKTQSIAIDFVFDNNKNPLVIEISYGFAPRVYDLCEGYWDKYLKFHISTNTLEYDIIEGLIRD